MKRQFLYVRIDDRVKSRTTDQLLSVQSCESQRSWSGAGTESIHSRAYIHYRLTYIKLIPYYYTQVTVPNAKIASRVQADGRGNLGHLEQSHQISRTISTPVGTLNNPGPKHQI